LGQLAYNWIKHIYKDYEANNSMHVVIRLLSSTNLCKVTLWPQRKEK